MSIASFFKKRFSRLPTGKPECLKGLVIVFTGTTRLVDRDTAKELVQQYGGVCRQAVSGKTTHVVTGSAPGKAKLDKAAAVGAKILSEDEFYELLESREPPAVTEVEDDSKKQKKTKRPQPKTKPKEKVVVAAPKPQEERKSKSPPQSSSSSLSLSSSSSTPLQTVSTGRRSSVSMKHQLTVAPAFRRQPTVQEICASSRQSANDLREMLWVDRYRPMRIGDLVGNTANIQALDEYVRSFYCTHHSPEGKANGLFLAGPPGCGKTTAAVMIGKMYGLEVIEFNASDVRSQSQLEKALPGLLTERSVRSLFTSGGGGIIRKMAIFDEVDGISGSADRGGITVIASLIRQAAIPVVCICNDINDKRMTTLKSVCKVLKWKPPTFAEIQPRLRFVCEQEGIEYSPSQAMSIYADAHGDMRQMINLLQMLSSGEANIEYEHTGTICARKDEHKTPQDAVNSMLLPHGRDQSNWMEESTTLHFVDAHMVPLLVQQNYLSTEQMHPPRLPPPIKRLKTLDNVTRAATSISDGDLVSYQIRHRQCFDLMPLEAALSSVIPAAAAAGQPPRFLGFPQSLGKMSTERKMRGLFHKLCTSLRCAGVHIGSPLSDSFHLYLQNLRAQLTQPFLQKGVAAVQEVASILRELKLTREDWSTICDEKWPSLSPPPSVSAACKRALTKAMKTS